MIFIKCKSCPRYSIKNIIKKMESTKGEDETFAKKTRKIVLVIAAYW